MAYRYILILYLAREIRRVYLAFVPQRQLVIEAPTNGGNESQREKFGVINYDQLF